MPPFVRPQLQERRWLVGAACAKNTGATGVPIAPIFRFVSAEKAYSTMVQVVSTVPMLT